MSLEIGNSPQRPTASGYNPLHGGAARPAPTVAKGSAPSPFGSDSVSFSEEAFQTAQLAPEPHLNTPMAIQAAQKNPGVEQKYRYGYNGGSGSVTWVNGELKWGK